MMNRRHEAMNAARKRLRDTDDIESYLTGTDAYKDWKSARARVDAAVARMTTHEEIEAAREELQQEIRAVCRLRRLADTMYGYGAYEIKWPEGLDPESTSMYRTGVADALKAALKKANEPKVAELCAKIVADPVFIDCAVATDELAKAVADLEKLNADPDSALDALKEAMQRVNNFYGQKESAVHLLVHGNAMYNELFKLMDFDSQAADEVLTKAYRAQKEVAV